MPSLSSLKVEEHFGEIETEHMNKAAKLAKRISSTFLTIHGACESVGLQFKALDT